jgi:hypothetical protein
VPQHIRCWLESSRDPARGHHTKRVIFARQVQAVSRPGGFFLDEAEFPSALDGGGAARDAQLCVHMALV